MRSKRQRVATGRNGSSLIQAVFARWAPERLRPVAPPLFRNCSMPINPKTGALAPNNDRRWRLTASVLSPEAIADATGNAPILFGRLLLAGVERKAFAPPADHDRAELPASRSLHCSRGD